MNFYLAVEHREDDDADYFRFTSLHLAIRYIQEEKLIDWTLMDKPFLNADDSIIDDYEFIG